MWGQRDFTALSPLSAQANPDRLLQTYELQIQDLESCAPSAPVWDGYCGLVKVSDEDLLPAPSAAAAAAEPAQQQQQQQARPDPRIPALTSSTSSPHKDQQLAAAAGVGHAGSLPTAQQLAERGRALLQAGHPQQAWPVLHTALQRCGLAQVGTAELVVGLLLEAEHQMGRLQLPDQGGAAAAAVPAALGPVSSSIEPGSGSLQPQAAGAGDVGGAAAREVRLALESLARDEPRRALAHLSKAEASCPTGASLELRRIALYRQLIQSKTHL